MLEIWRDGKWQTDQHEDNPKGFLKAGQNTSSPSPCDCGAWSPAAPWPSGSDCAPCRQRGSRSKCQHRRWAGGSAGWLPIFEHIWWVMSAKNNSWTKKFQSRTQLAAAQRTQKDSSHFCSTSDKFKPIRQSFFSSLFHLPVGFLLTRLFDGRVIRSQGLLASRGPLADWRRQKHHLNLQTGGAGLKVSKSPS